MKPSVLKKISLVGVVLGGLALLYVSGTIFETNQSENYQVKQAAVTGNLSVHSDPGMYMQNFGSIQTYRISDDIIINGASVRFRDGSTASVYGTVRFRSPVSEEQRLKLHREMQTYANVKQVLLQSAIDGALKQTANLFGAEEVYSTRRSEFVSHFQNQLKDGIYKTKVGRQMNEIVLDDNGNPVIAKTSVLTEYGFEVINIEIGDIDFDEKTDELIKARKDAEQQETLARAEAERAEQDAKTAEARGLANVAQVKYEALAVKEKAVIEAEKQTAIEQEKTLQAFEYAKQVEASKKAEAAGNKALVEAGLSPREQAEIEKETAIGVAQALANTKWPSIVVQGSGANGTAVDPLSVIALERMMAIPKVIADNAQQ